MIVNHILRKYHRNKNIRKVTHVKLTVPNQGIKVDPEKWIITVPCLKLSFNYEFPNHFEKSNQIEVGTYYIYVSVSIPENPLFSLRVFLGWTRNTTGHVADVANPTTGKVWKLGRQASRAYP